MEITDKQRKKLDVALEATGEVSFDYPDAILTFKDRLARDNGWSPEYATRVEHEYRLFACLLSTVDLNLTPSDQVDQAWHLHLLYTQNYWGEWAEALGKPLHHGPTPGSVEAGKRYWENYKRTLSLYRNAFGNAPPKDIWPSPQIRFDRPDRYVRLDTLAHIIFKKPGASR